MQQITSHASPSPWAGTRALFPTVPEQSATTVRRAGAFLRTRCGTLEEAFRSLDPSCTGSLTLETFARGMEKLGYESSLAETTQVFQAMDTGFRGSVGMASFLMAFNDNADDSRLSLQSARAVASSLTAAPDSIARSGSTCPSNIDSTERDLPEARRLVEEMIEDRIACSVMRLEGSVQADMASLREKIADCEKSAKADSVRLVERIEAKCMDAMSAAVEELNGKIESLRQKLRDAELVSAQQQLDACAVGNKIDSSSSETRGQLRILHGEFSEKVELMQSSMDGTLQAFRAEMREWLDEERAATNERTQALGRALTEEFQHSIVEQATASARTEACAVTCQVVSKEFETWQKEGSAVHTDLVQVTERLSKLEKRLLSLDSAEANGTLTCRNVGADTASMEKLAEDQKKPARLEGMLLSILEKLDNKCLDSFATDMKELSTLLEDPRLKAGRISDLGAKLHELDSTAYAASTTSEPSVADISSASKGQDFSERTSDETTKGMGIQKLREDIFGYLRSEFQDVVSQTIAGLNQQERATSVPRGGSMSLPQASRSPDVRHRELSLQKPGDGPQRRPNHSPMPPQRSGDVPSPAMGCRQLDHRISNAGTSEKRRESGGSVGPAPATSGGRTPLRLQSAQLRGAHSPPPPTLSKGSHSTTITSRPSNALPNGFDRGGSAKAGGSHRSPMTPTGQDRLLPSFGAGVDPPWHSAEVPRTDPDRDRETRTPLQVTQTRNAYDKRGPGNPSFGRVQSTPAPEEIRSAAVQAMHQRSTLSAAPPRSLSEAANRGQSPQQISQQSAVMLGSAMTPSVQQGVVRNRIGAIETASK